MSKWPELAWPGLTGEGYRLVVDKAEASMPNEALISREIFGIWAEWIRWLDEWDALLEKHGLESLAAITDLSALVATFVDVDDYWPEGTEDEVSLDDFASATEYAQAAMKLAGMFKAHHPDVVLFAEQEFREAFELRESPPYEDDPYHLLWSMWTYYGLEAEIIRDELGINKVILDIA